MVKRIGVSTLLALAVGMSACSVGSMPEQGGPAPEEQASSMSAHPEKAADMTDLASVQSPTDCHGGGPVTMSGLRIPDFPEGSAGLVVGYGPAAVDMTGDGVADTVGVIRCHFEETHINHDTVVVHSADGELIGSLPIETLMDPAVVESGVYNAMVDEIQLESGAPVVKWRGLAVDGVGAPAESGLIQLSMVDGKLTAIDHGEQVPSSAARQRLEDPDFPQIRAIGQEIALGELQTVWQTKSLHRANTDTDVLYQDSSASTVTHTWEQKDEDQNNPGGNALWMKNLDTGREFIAIGGFFYIRDSRDAQWRKESGQETDFGDPALGEDKNLGKLYVVGIETIDGTKAVHYRGWGLTVQDYWVDVRGSLVKWQFVESDPFIRIFTRTVQYEGLTPIVAPI